MNDVCDVCDGPGLIYECGCADIPEGDCDCVGNIFDCAGECGGIAALDNCDVCGGDGSSCMDILSNYLPESTKITNLFPNPFNPSINIKYELSIPTLIQLEIYNINGQIIDLIDEGYRMSGKHIAHWDGSNFPSGIYFVMMKHQSEKQILKIVLIK